MAGRAMLGLATRAGLALTPEVRLALELLQLPAPELRERVEREVAGNPLLEIEEEASETGDEEMVASRENRVDGRVECRDDGRDDGPADGPAGREDTDGMTDAWWSGSAALPRGVLEVSTAELPEWAVETTLAAHLVSQFRLDVRDPSVLAAAST
jgi:DNA-directed RNA polymerase specialized sigma54-like protein